MFPLLESRQHTLFSDLCRCFNWSSLHEGTMHWDVHVEIGLSKNCGLLTSTWLWKHYISGIIADDIFYVQRCGGHFWRRWLRVSHLSFCRGRNKVCKHCLSQAHGLLWNEQTILLQDPGFLSNANLRKDKNSPSFYWHLLKHHDLNWPVNLDVSFLCISQLVKASGCWNLRQYERFICASSFKSHLQGWNSVFCYYFFKQVTIFADDFFTLKVCNCEVG